MYAILFSLAKKITVQMIDFCLLTLVDIVKHLMRVLNLVLYSSIVREPCCKRINWLHASAVLATDMNDFLKSRMKFAKVP